MSDMRTSARIDGVDATAKIEDGRVSMTAAVTDALRVETPEHTPLSAREPHLTLRVVDDGVRVTLDLDGEDLDALADAVYQAQQRDE
jgi:hypothetical protein